MKRKLSLLLAMVLAMTMVMGIGVTAFADGSNQFEGTTWVVYRLFVAANPGDLVDHDYSIGDTVHTDDPYILTEDSCFVKFMENGVCEVSIRDMAEPMTYDPTTGIIAALVIPGYASCGLEGNSYIITAGFCTYYLRKLGGGVANQESPSEPAHTHTFTWQTIYEATPNSDGLEGEVCSCGATRNTSVISAMDYAVNKYADQMIKAAKPGQKITLEFGEFNSFPRYMMEKVAARMNENITFVFKFKQNKKMQTVTIEPGTAVDLQYDWYGPDKMKELYGAE